MHARSTSTFFKELFKLGVHVCSGYYYFYYKNFYLRNYMNYSDICTVDFYKTLSRLAACW